MRAAEGEPRRPSWERWPRAWDAACVLLVLAIAGRAYPRATRPEGVDLPADPWWGSWTDRVIEGPDAADWAINAQRMAAGDFDSLDPHRMPSWLTLVALLIRGGWNAVEAGHLVNRGMFFAAIVGTFLLGRVTGGRAVGVLAATFIATQAHLLQATQRYGIDAAIEGLLPIAVASGAWVGPRWRLGLPLGLVAGWIALLHFTTVPFLVPALGLLLITGARRTRVAGALLFACGSALVLVIASGFGVVPDPGELGRALTAGLSRPPGPVGVIRPAEALGSMSLAARIGETVAIYRGQLSDTPLPARLIPLLGALGVVGAFLPAPGMNRPGLRGIAIGACLLLCLAPVLVIMAAESDLRFRYPNNFVPFAAVLVARGVASAGFGIEAASGRLGWNAPPGVLPGIVACLATMGAFAPASMPPPLGAGAPTPELSTFAMQDEVLGTFLLGRAIAETFPPGTRVVCPSREVLLQADRLPCPLPFCPQTPDEPALASCMAMLATQCGVDATVGYVVLPGRFEYDISAPARTALDAWVARHVPPAASVVQGAFTASVYRVPVRPD